MSDEARRARTGQTVGCMPNALGTDDDPLFTSIRGNKADARRGGIEDEAIGAELAAYNAERRDRG